MKILNFTSFFFGSYKSCGHSCINMHFYRLTIIIIEFYQKIRCIGGSSYKACTKARHAVTSTEDSVAKVITALMDMYFI